MTRFPLLIRHWHRWLGMAVALPALVLAVTGILLNHVDSMGLDEATLPVWAAEEYGVPVPESFDGAPLGEHWLAFVGEQLYLDEQPLAGCAWPFQGAVFLEKSVVVGCGSDLMLPDGNGHFIEYFSSSWGLPPWTRLGSHAQQLVLFDGARASYFSLDQLTSSELPEEAVPEEAIKQAVPESLAKRLRTYAVPPELNWERFLLDLHGGRLFGKLGWLVVDLAGVAMLVLIISGTVMWYRAQKRRYR